MQACLLLPSQTHKAGRQGGQEGGTPTHLALTGLGCRARENGSEIIQKLGCSKVSMVTRSWQLAGTRALALEPKGSAETGTRQPTSRT